MKPETRAKIAEAQRLRHPPGSGYDVDAMFAAIRRHSTFKDAAAELGLVPKALQSRVARLAAAGKLPPDIMAIRQRNIERPNHNRPPQKPKAASAIRRPGKKNTALFQPTRMIHKASEPEPYAGPVKVIEVPSPAWPLPRGPEPVNVFRQRRIELAKQRHAQTWRERTGENAP